MCKSIQFSMTRQTLPWNPSDDAPLESKKLDSEVPLEIVPSCVCYNFKSFCFFCGQGTANVQPWVPYRIRIRDFFERWPGAMKASHVKCMFQRLCFFLLGRLYLLALKKPKPCLMPHRCCCEIKTSHLAVAFFPPHGDEPLPGTCRMKCQTLLRDKLIFVAKNEMSATQFFNFQILVLWVFTLARQRMPRRQTSSMPRSKGRRSPVVMGMVVLWKNLLRKGPLPKLEQKRRLRHRRPCLRPLLRRKKNQEAQGCRFCACGITQGEGHEENSSSKASAWSSSWIWGWSVDCGDDRQGEATHECPAWLGPVGKGCGSVARFAMPSKSWWQALLHCQGPIWPRFFCGCHFEHRELLHQQSRQASFVANYLQAPQGGIIHGCECWCFFS